MSHHNGLAMTSGKSVPSPQSTGSNSAATIGTLKNPSMSSAGSDRLTSLPAELLQQVASNLSAHSIMALRSTNKAAATKTFTNFVDICFYHLPVQTTKAGINQALEDLQIQGASKATTHVTFTSDLTNDGHRSKLIASTPSQASLKALPAQLPKLTSITIRDGTTHGLNTWNICCAIASTSIQLTELTLDSCAVPGSTLLRLLNTHCATLTYVAFRGLQLTDSTAVKTVIMKLPSAQLLDRVVLDSLSNSVRFGGKLVMISRQALNTQREPVDYVTRAWTSRTSPGTPQQYTMAEHHASMTGVEGVRRGIRGILSGRFR